MATPRDPRPFIGFILLILLLNSPEPQQQTFASRSRYDQVITQERDALEILNRTHYGDFDYGEDRWLNLTGFRQEDGYGWDLLSPVQQRAKVHVGDLLGSQAEPSLDGILDDSEHAAVYRNVSGFVQGEWVRSSQLGQIRQPSDLNLSALIPDIPYTFTDYDRNLTGSSGAIRLHFTENEDRVRTNSNKSVSEISARMVIYDDSSLGDWWEFTLNGVHFTKFGGAVLTTTSEKFAGIFALPHLALTEYLYSISQDLLNRTIYDTIERQTSRSYPIWNPWTSAVDGSSDAMLAIPHCEYIVYLQEHPVIFDSPSKQYPSSNPYYLSLIEDEIRFPTGSPLPRRTPLSMSMIAFSPDCGFVIESKGPPDYARTETAHLKGFKTEQYLDKARLTTLGFAVTLTFQLMFLVRQMKETSTPSTRNRVSFYTIAMLALGDGFAFLTLIFMHLILGTSMLALYTTAFLALFSVVFELRFLMDIWTIQATERRRQERQQTSTSQTTATSTTTPLTPSVQTRERAESVPVISAAESENLPLPATSHRPETSTEATPVILPPDQNVEPAAENIAAAGGEATGTLTSRAELGTLYTRYCFFLIITFFLTLHSTSWPTVARSVYCNIISFAYLSFWCPQIYRNVMRNCRKALQWDFVLGQSAVRLVPITYIYAVSDNVLFSQTDIPALLVLVGWVWIQILALVSQEILGSRFFIRDGWAPPAYDYHPVLREDEEGATMPIGSTQMLDEDSASSPSATKAGESRSKGKKVFDCTICTQDIEVPVLPSGASAESSSGLGGNILARRSYMVTPCRHIFHTSCLEGWMRYRLQCPNCREILPPL